MALHRFDKANAVGIIADAPALLVFKVAHDIIIGKLEFDDLKVLIGSRRLIGLGILFRSMLRNLLFGLQGFLIAHRRLLSFNARSISRFESRSAIAARLS